MSGGRARLARWGLLSACGYIGWSVAQPPPVKPENLDIILRHPYVAHLQDEGYKIQRSHPAPFFHRNHMVVKSILSGPGKFECDPVRFCGPQGRQETLYLIGTSLASKSEALHPGIVATMFDECLAAAAFPQLPRKIGVTGKLEVDHVNPIPVCSLISLRAKPDPDVSSGNVRKAGASGEIYLVDDYGDMEAAVDTKTPLAHGNIVMIEPRWARYIAWLLPSSWGR